MRSSFRALAVARSLAFSIALTRSPLFRFSGCLMPTCFATSSRCPLVALASTPPAVAVALFGRLERLLVGANGLVVRASDRRRDVVAHLLGLLVLVNHPGHLRHAPVPPRDHRSSNAPGRGRPACSPGTSSVPGRRGHHARHPGACGREQARAPRDAGARTRRRVWGGPAVARSALVRHIR